MEIKDTTAINFLNRKFSEKDELTTGVEIKNTTDQDFLTKKLAEKNNALDQEEKQQSIFSTVKDIFSGTKSTEYTQMPEIGSYKGEGALKTAGALMLTPDMEAQADIILKSIPGSAVREDKYQNPIIVMPDGKNFYLNKPGASFQDVLQTTSQMLQYIPGYNYVAKKLAKSYFKRVLAQGAVGGGTSVAQDVVAGYAGSKKDSFSEKLNEGIGGISGTRAIVNTVVPTAFEGIAVPVGKFGLNILARMGKHKEYLTLRQDGKYALTDAGKKAAKEMGVDVDKLDGAVLDDFYQKLVSGIEGETAALLNQGGEFGIDLAASQTGKATDKISLANLYEAAKGNFGNASAKTAGEFLEKQNIQIQTSFKSIMEKFNKGQIDIADIDSIGGNLLSSLRDQFKKASDNVDIMYNVVNKKAEFLGSGSNIQLLTNSARKAVIDSVGSIDQTIMPKTVAVLKSLDDFGKEIDQAASGKVTPIIFDRFEKKRQFINDLISTATRSGEKTEVRALMGIKKEFDKFVDDSINNVLFSGDKAGLEALKKARKAVIDRERNFGNNPIIKNGVVVKDKAGQVLGQILEDPAITPIEVINYALGSKVLGAGGVPLRVVQRLKKIMNISKIDDTAFQNADFVALRTATLQRVFENAINTTTKKFSPEVLVKQFNEVFKNNKAFMAELFTNQEIAELRRFVGVVKNTLAPRDLVNLSNTSSTLMRAMQSGTRGFLGALMIKMGFGINGLLAVRNAFDRSLDIIGQNQAKNLVQKQLTGGVKKLTEGIGRSPAPLATVPSGVSGVAGTPISKVSVAQGALNQGIGQSTQGIGAEPIKPYELDRNMFGSLFPGDTLGAAISQRNQGNQ
jgi:hypothetical protein